MYDYRNFDAVKDNPEIDIVYIVLPNALQALVSPSPPPWHGVMESWVSDFPYRIALSAAMFVVGGSVVIGLALTTIWLQAARAARVNPVESLRAE